MRTKIWMKMVPLLLAGLFLSGCIVISGCVVIIGGCNWKDNTPPISSERQEILSGSAAAIERFQAETQNGSIKVTGQSTDTCTVQATITARGETQEQADQLVQEVELSLVPQGSTLQLEIHKPDSPLARYISVRLEVQVPQSLGAHLRTTNGDITVYTLDRAIDAGTTNGTVTIEQAMDSITAQSTNGSIHCRQVQGDAKLHSTNGDITVKYNAQGPVATNVKIETTNGSVTIDTAGLLSAVVDAGTVNGGIRSDLPVQVRGDLGNKTLRGTVGDGQGKVYLRTTNGSITIR